MTTTIVSIHPYFDVQEDKIEDFKAAWRAILPVVAGESKCLHYEFSFNGNRAFCRELYADAEGLLAHLGNVGAVIGATSAFSSIVRLEIHGSESELNKIRAAGLSLGDILEYYVVELGIQR